MIQYKDKKAKFQRTAFIILMLAWPVCHFLVFWLYVNLDTFRLTFFRFNTLTAEYEWYGFTRFELIWQDMILGADETIRNCFINSLLCLPVQNFIILPLSFFSAFFLYKKVPLAGVFRVVFFLPSILSIVVLTMSFKFMFNADFGPIKYIVESLFGVAPDYFSSMSPTAMPLVFTFGVWAGLGYDIILINGAISRIPEEVIESAKLDGVGLFREMFRIVLPLVMPTISTLFILGSLGVFGYYLQPMLLCGESGGVNGATGTIAMRVMSMMQSQDTENAAALGLFFSLIGIPFVLLIKWGMEKITPDVEF